MYISRFRCQLKAISECTRGKTASPSAASTAQGTPVLLTSPATRCILARTASQRGWHHHNCEIRGPRARVHEYGARTRGLAWLARPRPALCAPSTVHSPASRCVAETNSQTGRQKPTRPTHRHRIHVQPFACALRNNATHRDAAAFCFSDCCFRLLSRRWASFGFDGRSRHRLTGPAMGAAAACSLRLCHTSPSAATVGPR